MADLELQIPQQMKHRFGGAPLRCRWRLFRQEHEVEVAERRHLAAAGTAEPDERKTVERLADDAPGDEIVAEPNELIVEEGGGLGGGTAVARLLPQPLRDFLTPSIERSAKHPGPFGAKLLAGLERGQMIADRAAVDDRALVVDMREAHPSFSAANLFSRYNCSSASRGVSASGSISPIAAVSGSGPRSGSVAAANKGKSSRPAAIPPVASRPASSLARTDFARPTTAGGKPASLATAIP